MMKDTIARYEIRSELGKGGMAAVYLAYDPNFRRNVAVKLISVNLQENPVFRERFEREARLIAQVEHPAIVPVYDFGEEGDQLYLVMRYMAGGTLTEKIKQGKSTLEYAVRILSQIAPALDAVHAQGVVHRDLKPGNILLDNFGNPAISDFGIAFLTAATTDLTGNAVIGTPSYMSPEQVRSEADLDGRSDVYALGVILFEMLTGHGPFNATTPLSAALKHLTDPIPPIRSFRPDMPMEVEYILYKAMAKERDARYASASEFALELEEVVKKYKDGNFSSRSTEQLPLGQDAATEVEVGYTVVEAPPPSPPQSAPSISKEQVSKPQMPQPKRSAIGTPQIILGVGVIGVLLLFVCGSIGLLGTLLNFGSPSTPTPEAVATFTPPAAVVATSTSPAVLETVLFTDDFSDPNSGWPVFQNAQGRYSYEQDGYHISVDQRDAVLWAKTTRADDNISVSVDAQLSANGASGYYGLLCRMQDDQNFYYFLIQPNGSYTIGKYKNGEFLSLIPTGWRESNVIAQGDGANLLKADCSGSTLGLYVNGILLDETTDTDFTSGFSGIVAAALDERSFEVVFNNFRITSSNQ